MAFGEDSQLSDVPPESFAIMTFCELCGHQVQLDRGKVPRGVTVQQLPTLLLCSQCGEKAGSTRILYSGAERLRISYTSAEVPKVATADMAVTQYGHAVL